MAVFGVVGVAVDASDNDEMKTDDLARTTCRGGSG
ncbi:hypothetical protein SNOG_02948 [Parastagonospora nodorum SN15]|uniref:Uncharacterized protein n=1 Tax=Phaeosphaeria nodorum (strain SN15 / ATCC MYA-4574 / FGSC 10173) TaxID=321614 RepID=Q0UZ66_PHANO|nr:hypothetical protein SNOG_02948 [Parastagonospora nodorum SN15]EAT89679.1 hypothetical protein SNOG_02948 [Parastagonospora nodorum SN15]